MASERLVSKESRGYIDKRGGPYKIGVVVWGHPTAGKFLSRLVSLRWKPDAAGNTLELQVQWPLSRADGS